VTAPAHVAHVYETAAIRIVDWLHHAERDLIGKVIATFNGETGKVLGVRVDDHHGLCFTIDPAEDPTIVRRWYPVSTIKQVAL
jgi:hypothetical protein